MKQRIEDLGALRVMIDNITDLEVFNFYHGRNKDFIGWFSDQSEEDRHNMLHNMIYGLESIKEKLYECLEIARGEDSLNLPESDKL